MSDTRAADGTGTPVPVVPPSAGPRMFAILSVVIGVLGLGFAVGAFFGLGAGLADSFGLADRSTATVVERDLRSQDEWSRGCDQNYDYDVTWDDREGSFSVCLGIGDPLADLEVGDRVEIASVPWSSSVSPESDGAGPVWAGLFIVGLVLVPTYGVIWFRRYRRLMRGGVTGTRFTGTVRKGRVSTSVVLGDRRLVLLPVKEMRSLATGDPAEVWSTRRSWFRKRPAGPWVLRSRGQVGAFTNAWWRKSS